jgi:hypothetical protein
MLKDGTHKKVIKAKKNIRFHGQHKFDFLSPLVAYFRVKYCEHSFVITQNFNNSFIYCFSLSRVFVFGE